MFHFFFWKFIGTKDLGTDLVLGVGSGVLGCLKTTQMHVSEWGRRAETWPGKINGLFNSGRSP